MKHLLTLIVAVTFVYANAWAQCTPNAATGNPGLSPVTDSLPCVEIGIPYSEVVHIENFDDFTITLPPPLGTQTITMDSLRIDSITNVPCGLTWQANKPSQTYYAGETGCIAINGTSYENVGQYRLNIYITVWVTVPILGAQTYSGEAAQVVADIEDATGQSLGVDFDYFLRVIQPSDPCPAVDRTTPGVNLTASATCGPPVFTATVTGDTEICDGETTTLTVTFTNGTPPYDILWSTGGTSTTLTVGAGTYDIVAVDSNTDTARATVVVTELPLPVADFTVSSTAGSGAVTVTDNSTNATTYTWYFSDLDTVVGTNPSFTFTANGDYDVTLITTNACGSDTTVETVTISGIVGINNLGTSLASVQVMPNPSNGNFTLNVVATQTSPVSVKVFNLQGQQVYASTINAVAGQANTQAIRLSDAATGIYILQVQANDALVTEKLIVK